MHGDGCVPRVDLAGSVSYSQVEHVMNEKNILAMCNHPFLLGLAATFKDEEELYMLMELSLGGWRRAVSHHLTRETEVDGNARGSGGNARCLL
eukprot:27243-Pleurochrysis_carterae.AAC.1